MDNYEVINIPTFLTTNTEGDTEIMPRGCTTHCEKKCQAACMFDNQSGGCTTNNQCLSDCQVSGCQDACQSACQSACEKNCQNCQYCQTSCERGCESSCQKSCQGQHVHGATGSTAYRNDGTTHSFLQYCSCGSLYTTTPNLAHEYTFTGYSQLSDYQHYVNYRCFCSSVTSEIKSHSFNAKSYSYVNNSYHLGNYQCDCGKTYSSQSEHYRNFQRYEHIPNNTVRHNQIHYCTACSREYYVNEDHKYGLEYYQNDNIYVQCTLCGFVQWVRSQGNFSWHTAKNSESLYNLNTREWNEYVLLLNLKARGKGKSVVNANSQSGQQVSARVTNLVLAKLRELSATGVPADIGNGTKLSASFLNSMVSALNSIK